VLITITIGPHNTLGAFVYTYGHIPLQPQIVIHRHGDFLL
jgi:hypothetical protein